MQMTVYGEVEDVEVFRDDGDRKVRVKGSSSGHFVLEPTREGFDRLIDALERARPSEDNAFREEPDPNQTSLDELDGAEESGPSDDPTVWDRAGLSEGDLDDLEVTEPELAFGEVLNENDPSEW